MVLNSLSQNFVIAFDFNTFYSDVNSEFIPLLHRQYLPYNTLEDFINSQITSVNFPGVDTPVAQQNIGLHQIAKRNGKDVEQQRSRQITMNIKTSESLLTYFICMRQYELFQQLGKYMPLYFPNLTISLLNDGGFTQFSYIFKQLTPTSLSGLELSYAARLGQFTTFTWSFNYNYYEVWAVSDNGKMECITSDYEPLIDFPKTNLDSDDEKYAKRTPEHRPVSTKNSMRVAPYANGLRSLSNYKPGVLSTSLK